jgi:hypothetical protein
MEVGRAGFIGFSPKLRLDGTPGAACNVLRVAVVMPALDRQWAAIDEVQIGYSLSKWSFS